MLSRRPPGRIADHRADRSARRGLRSHGLQGRQRAGGRGPDDPLVDRGHHPPARVPAAEGGGPRRPARTGLPRGARALPDRDLPRRPASGRRTPTGRRGFRVTGPPHPGARLGRGCAGPPPDRCRLGVLRTQRRAGRTTAHPGHTVRARRSDRGSRPRRPVGEREQLEWRAVGDRHLLELGHRRIAVITGGEHVLAGRARLDGYRAALDMAGIPVDPALVRVGDFQILDGLKHTRDLLRLPEPPTAVFTGNDGQALGVYRAAAEAGLRVPEDLSVVGFDDLFPSRWLTPPLTTVRQPLAEMAATAAGMVIALAQGRPLERGRAELATELVVRGSTAPFRG